METKEIEPPCRDSKYLLGNNEVFPDLTPEPRPSVEDRNVDDNEVREHVRHAEELVVGAETCPLTKEQYEKKLNPPLESDKIAFNPATSESLKVQGKDTDIPFSSRHMTAIFKICVLELAKRLHIPPDTHPDQPKGRMLYIQRAWQEATERRMPTHAEGRAADMRIVELTVTQKEIPKDKEAKLIADASGLLQKKDIAPGTRVFVSCKEGPTAWKVDGDSGTIQVNQTLEFTVEQSEKATLHAPTVSKSELAVYFWKFREFQSGSPKGTKLLACAALHSGFDFVHAYTGPNKSENIHGSVIAGDLNRLDWKVDWFRYARALQAGGWRTLLLENILVADPIVILPPEEIAASSVPIYPRQPRPGLTLGEVILQTAWSRGLSPRATFAVPKTKITDPGRVVLRLERSPLARLGVAVPRPVSVATLKHSLGPCAGTGGFWTCQDNARGKPLFKVIEELTRKENEEKKEAGPYPNIRIDADAGLRPQFVCITQEEALPAESTFSDVMDAIAIRLGAIWDWYGDGRVLMMPRPGNRFEGNCIPDA